LPKPIVEHAVKQNDKTIKELLSQCKEHSLELLEERQEPMLRLDLATRKVLQSSISKSYQKHSGVSTASQM